MLRNFTLFILLCAPIFLAAQNIVITGVVTDAANGETLVGATVAIKNTSTGVRTDINGHYSISAPADATLTFRYTGFNDEEVAVKGRTKIDVELLSDAVQLEDVVVVGYGVQKKSQVTGAISSIRNKDFKDQPVTNLANSIQGRVSGLNVVSPSGTPGAGLLVSVRGNQNPLYVVDGIPLLSESNSALSTAFDLQGNVVGSGQTLSSVSDINPNDIESIEILKDASAAAIYGARAANGVVLITTRRGKQGKTEVGLNYYTGFQQVMRPIEFMSSQQFVELVEEARANDLRVYEADPTAFGPDFDPAVLTAPLENFDLSSGINTNWLDEVTRTAPISNYEVSMRGGTDKTRFFTSAGYFDQQGVVIENFYRRLNYRLNLDHNVNSKFSIGTNFSTTYSRNRRSFNDDTYTGIITNALGASPLMPAYEADGSYAAFENYQASWLSDNPVKSAKEIRAYTNNYRVLGTAFGEYSILKNLKFKTSWSADASFIFDNQFKSQITADAEAVGGEAYEANFRNLTWLNENTLNYTRQSGKHGLNLLGGFTAQRTQIDRGSATGQGFPPGTLERVSSAAAITSASSIGTAFSLASFLGRVNYDYDNRYLITASGRMDGSSRFSKNNRYGFFPSASVAWRLSNEQFWHSKLFTDTKLRVSYGVTGDQEIGDFENISFYGPVRYDGLPALMLRNIADPNLGWQRNRMLNVGFDFEIKQGRFSGAIEFFKSNKDRLLSEDVIPGTTGFSTVTRNSGEVQNTGLEFNLNASLIRRKHFSWQAAFNTTYVRNKIVSLSSDGILLNAYSDLEATHILKVGESLGSFMAIEYLGVDPQTGDAMYRDANGDGNIDFDDARISGDALPDWFGGLTNNFTWKNFDLSIFARFVTGNKVFNLIRATTDNLGWSNEGGLSSVYANNTTNLLDRWKKPGDSGTEYGRASFINPNFLQNSTQFIEDGSFVRIQNVTLGYNLKKVAKVSSVRLYAQAQNLFLFSKYKGFDPEVSSNGASTERTAGVDYGAYPSARTITFGVDVKF
ncbi:MAG: TonB-dependent receptor [Saprospiraceae bacterium]|nr:TonB-dependent receptor [Saprospiraceae bacterium]